MRRRMGIVMVVAALLTASASRADAITLGEIIDLTRAGLSEDVLLALIEVDQRVFAIDPVTLKTLKDAGVSPRVIVAIVKSGRTPQPEPPPMIEAPPVDPPESQVVVVERPVIVERSVIYEVPVAVPVYVAAGGRSHARHRQEPYVAPQSAFVPFGAPPSTREPAPKKRAEPVYWGWGGKLRPDAWQPEKK